MQSQFSDNCKYGCLWPFWYRRSSKWEVWDNISSQFTPRPFISLCLSLHKRLLSFVEAGTCWGQKINAFLWRVGNFRLQIFLFFVSCTFGVKGGSMGKQFAPRSFISLYLSLHERLCWVLTCQLWSNVLVDSLLIILLLHFWRYILTILPYNLCPISSLKSFRHQRPVRQSKCFNAFLLTP